MCTRLTATLTVVAFTCLGSAAVHGSGTFDLRAFAGVEPQRVGLSTPEITLKPRQIKLEPIEKDSWRYTLDGESLVIGSITFRLEGTPQQYSYIPIEVRAFYTENPPRTVHIYAVHVDDGRNSASDLFAFQVKGASGIDELFRYYQRAAVMSKKRLQAIEAGRPLYAYDVQVFFKFLEIARELGTIVNLAPGEDVRRVRGFLQTRLEVPRDRRVVANAIPRGINDVQLLINQIDFMEIEQLERLWELIKKEDVPGATTSVCPRYHELSRVINSVDPILKRRLEDFAKRVVDAVNRCMTRTAEAAILSGVGISEEVREQLTGWITPIPAPQDARSSGRLAQALQNQADVLRRFGINDPL